MRIPDGCEDAQWTGTPALTRESQQWSAHRLFLVGDAAGYVEPFTGEGMSWALAGAVEASRLADAGIKQWRDDLALKWHSIWRTSFASVNQPSKSGMAAPPPHAWPNSRWGRQLYSVASQANHA